MRAVLVAAAVCSPGGADIALPDDAEVEAIHPGVVRFEIERPDVPLAVFGVVWDRDQTELAVRATGSFDRARGREIIREQVGRLRTDRVQPLAAVNGDFSMIVGPFAGSTNGPFVRDGRMLRFVNDRPTFMVNDDGTLAIGDIATTVTIAPADDASGIRSSFALDASAINRPVENGGLIIYTPDWGESTDAEPGTLELAGVWAVPEMQPDVEARLTIVGEPGRTGDRAIPPHGVVIAAREDREAWLGTLSDGDELNITVDSSPGNDLEQAVGGWPVLVRDSEIVFEARDSEPRHPRTAIGFDTDQGVMLVIDGRWPGYSRGVTLPELAEFMHELGCAHAMNLDGGGSSTMWVRGEVINRPSDGRERALPNGLALVSNTSVGPAALVRIDPTGTVVMTAGAQVPISAQVTDRHLHPVEGAASIRWAVDRDLARVAEGELIAEAPGAVVIEARSGEAVGRREVRIVQAPDRLVVTPSFIELVPGQAKPISVRGELGDGTRVAIDPRRLALAAPTGVTVVEDQTIRAETPSAGVSGWLAVSGYGLNTSVPVVVAGAQTFETFADSASDIRVTTARGFESAELDRDEAGHVRMSYAFDAGSDAIQAVYLRLDRPKPRSLALRARVRGDGQRVHIKAAVVDGNGSRLLYNMHRGEIADEWTWVEGVLPEGLKQPATWQSVYVVHVPGSGTALEGAIEIDQLDVLIVPDVESEPDGLVDQPVESSE